MEETQLSLVTPRIAIDLRPLLDPHESGVTVYTKSVVSRLIQDASVEWLLFYQAKHRCERIHQLFPSVRHVAHSNTIFHLKSLFRFPVLPSTYFEEQPDLLWMPDRRPFYRCPFPVVMTVHDRIPESQRSSLSFKSKIWHSFFPLKRLLTLTDGLLFPSLTVSQAVRSRKPKEVTYEGVESFKTAVRPEALSKKIKSKSFFLALSPADPRKRLEWILRAAQRFPKMDFVIAGYKKNDQRFKKMKIQKLENLHFLSFVTEEEKAWLYQNATALLSLSRDEGFDLPVLEAVHAKCPVLLSDIPVHNELYKDAEWIKTEEDLWKSLYLAQSSSLKVPQPRGGYTWEKTTKRSLLFFLRVLFHKDR